MICHSDKERSDEEESAIGGQLRGTIQNRRRELRYGAAKKNSPRLTAQLETVLGGMEVLPFEAPADATYGTLRTRLEQAGEPIGGNDLLIAAQTIALGYTIVTDSEKEFARVRETFKTELAAVIANKNQPRQRRHAIAPDGVRGKARKLSESRQGRHDYASHPKCTCDPSRPQSPGAARISPPYFTHSVGIVAAKFLMTSVTCVEFPSRSSSILEVGPRGLFRP